MNKFKLKMGMLAQRVVDWGMGNGLMQEENMATGNDNVTSEMAYYLSQRIMSNIETSTKSVE